MILFPLCIPLSFVSAFAFGRERMIYWGHASTV